MDREAVGHGSRRVRPGPSSALPHRPRAIRAGLCHRGPVRRRPRVRNPWLRARRRSPAGAPLRFDAARSRASRSRLSASHSRCTPESSALASASAEEASSRAACSCVLRACIFSSCSRSFASVRAASSAAVLAASTSASRSSPPSAARCSAIRRPSASTRSSRDLACAIAASATRHSVFDPRHCPRLPWPARVRRRGCRARPARARVRARGAFPRPLPAPFRLPPARVRAARAPRPHPWSARSASPRSASRRAFCRSRSARRCSAASSWLVSAAIRWAMRAGIVAPVGPVPRALRPALRRPRAGLSALRRRPFALRQREPRLPPPPSSPPRQPLRHRASGRTPTAPRRSLSGRTASC